MKIANIQKVRTKTVRDISQPGTISSEIIISIAAIKPNKSASNPAFNEGEKSINRRSKLADIANANATTLRGCALSKICKRLFASNWNLKNVHHYYKKRNDPNQGIRVGLYAEGNSSLGFNFHYVTTSCLKKCY
jgi:hypothetical protein